MAEASWDILGLAPTADAGAIRRAYAAKLRVTRPEDDPEGFRRLRAAYEAALELTARPLPPEPLIGGLRLARLDVPWSIQGQPHLTPAPGGEILPLQEALDALTRALGPEARVGGIPLQRLLARVLDLAMHGSLEEQRGAEASLARMLLDSAPRSDQLLEECVRRLGWERQERALVPDPLLLAVLARRRDLAMLAALRSGHHPLAAAFAELARPANRAGRWWRAHVTLIRRRPALQLLDLLTAQHRGLLPELDPGELAWWRRFERGPKLSTAMLGAGIAFIPWLMLVHATRIVKLHPWADLWQLVCWPAGFALLLLARLYLLDLPAYLIAQRAVRPRLTVLAGWLPLQLALFGVSFAVHGLPGSALALAAAGGCGCLWAVYVSGPVSSVWQGRQFVPGNSRLLRVLLRVPVPALWCALALQDLGWPPHFSGLEDARWVAAACLMSGSALGSPALRVLWGERMTRAQRRVCLGALILAALGAGAALTWVGGPWQPMVVWLLVGFIVVHRIALLSLSAAQDRVRWLILIAALAPMLPAAMASQVTPTDVVFGLGLALVVSAFLNLCMALTGSRRQDAVAE
jgi:hypothetical protein